MGILHVLAFLVIGQDQPSPEWTPVLDAPKTLTHELTIPPPASPGKRMEIRGKVLKSDGKTPFPGVIVYFYHTDGEGIYPRPAGSKPTEWLYWHGSVRGWLMSDSEGNYVLKSTLPAPYPTGRTPAHIHVYGLAPGSSGGVMFSGIVFEGDPLLTERDTGILRLTEDKNGVLQGRFNLVFPR